MKKLYLIILLFGFSNAFAQQKPQYTQYMLNDFIINPAVAGIDDYFVARSNNRYQWVGITDYPRTYTLSFYGPHKTKNIGFGGYVFSDETGPTRTSGVYGSFAHNFKLTDKIKLSYGLHVGLLQFDIDETQITFTDPEEQITDFDQLLPDANFGIMLYGEKFYFGFSANQLFKNKFDFVETTDTTDIVSQLYRHFFFMAGYKLDLNENIRIEPSVFVKALYPTPTQIEANLKATFMKKVWVGTSYRASLKMADVISISAGCILEEQFMIGYSYDISMSSLNDVSSGTHELMLGIRFNKARKENASGSLIE